MTNPNKTLIIVVLDRSGSMESVRNDTIGGYNTFLAEQKKQPGDCELFLARFDHEYEIVHDNVNIASAPELNTETFVPRGSTALYDAVGRTINAVGATLSKKPENERPGKVVFAIITDGHENASKEFSHQKISQMIKQQTEKYSWKFTYLGATLDAKEIALDLGIASSLRYGNNMLGSQAVFKAFSSANVRMRSGETYCYNAQEVADAEASIVNVSDSSTNS